MKKRGAALLCCLTLLMSLISCGTQTKRQEGLALYYASDLSASRGGDAIAPVYVDADKQASVTDQAVALLRMMMEGAQAGKLHSPIPEGTELLSCEVENGIAKVDFSGAYGQLSGMDLTVADYCVTLTLTQLKGVFTVYITVNGKELTYRDTNSFMASDALLSSTEDIVRSVAVTLYFPDKNTRVLTGEDRLLTWYEGQSQADDILAALLAGPASDSLTTVVPAEFKIASVRIDDRICYVNLPQSDLSLLPEDLATQQMILRSLVNSLCSVDGIDGVQLLLAGSVRNTTFGKIDISRPFTATE
ncbi:MAG: GerMN domain-containing protein [Clostridiales bacterium]|nr:GerMN domain-containing protein [Clostridiales bacterium]